MLGHGTQLSERFIGLCPVCKLPFDCLDHACERGEVTIVEAQPARQLPDPLDRIQIRAIGWQVTQYELGFLLRSPLCVKLGMVILGIIRDHDHPVPGPTAAPVQLAKKIPGGHRVKAGGFTLEQKLSISQTHGAEIANTFASGVVKQHRVVHLGWNPHSGAGTVLLKMNFINRPQVNGWIFCQCAEFFYAWLGPVGQLERLTGAACAAESPTGETASGTDAPLVPLRTSVPSSGRAFCHPKRRRLPLPSRPEFASRRFQRRPFESYLRVKEGQGVLPRSIRPGHPFQSDGPSSPPCATRHRAHWRLRGN